MRSTLRHTLDFVAEVARSRTGLALFLSHLALVSCAHASLGGWALSSFDRLGESLLVGVLFVLNLPVLVAALLAASPVLYERRVEEFGALQWAAASLVVFCVFFQWWFYGYLVDRARGNVRRAPPPP